MLYVLLFLVILVIILLIIANIQKINSNKYENLTISTISNKRAISAVKPYSRDRKISSIIHNKPNDRTKEIEDVQILDDIEKTAYSLQYT
jgi:uncharacterized protein (UPF0333 family)